MPSIPFPPGGLSPRVRGNPTIEQLSRGQIGSIPACAGEPPTSTTQQRAPEVYPRVCGGTGVDLLALGADDGLSPRVRGNPFCNGDNTSQPGSIPACAGEPGGGEGCRRERQVYPRVCGGTQGGGGGGTSGLSPRVRGNRWNRGRPPPLPGSIPACAGEPAQASTSPGGHGVYPRVCGGTGEVGRWHGRRRGLSPRVRGNHSPTRSRRFLTGSIPACAGEPRRDHRALLFSAVYPRVCGGTPSLTRVGVPVMGSIPACAGEPRVATPIRGQIGVYPRVCGGTRDDELPFAVSRGLSPRVRGNPQIDDAGRRPLRSIPACAGEPGLGAVGRVDRAVYPRVCGGTHARATYLAGCRGLSPRVRGNHRPRLW